MDSAACTNNAANCRTASATDALPTAGSVSASRRSWRARRARLIWLAFLISDGGGVYLAWLTRADGHRLIPAEPPLSASAAACNRHRHHGHWPQAHAEAMTELAQGVRRWPQSHGGRARRLRWHLTPADDRARTSAAGHESSGSLPRPRLRVLGDRDRRDSRGDCPSRRGAAGAAPARATLSRPGDGPDPFPKLSASERTLPRVANRNVMI